MEISIRSKRERGAIIINVAFALLALLSFSAIVDERGRVLERSAVSERRVLQREVTLREGLTLYTRLGTGPGLLLAALCLAAGWAVERRRASP